MENTFGQQSPEITDFSSFGKILHDAGYTGELTPQEIFEAIMLPLALRYESRKDLVNSKIDGFLRQAIAVLENSPQPNLDGKTYREENERFLFPWKEPEDLRKPVGVPSGTLREKEWKEIVKTVVRLKMDNQESVKSLREVFDRESPDY